MLPFVLAQDRLSLICLNLSATDEDIVKPTLAILNNMCVASWVVWGESQANESTNGETERKRDTDCVCVRERGGICV
jgi:hypothetical protein